MKDSEQEGSDSVEKPPEAEANAHEPIKVDFESIPPTGRRPALRNIRRQLTNDELAQSGTQKMLLEMLEEAENQKDRLESYVTSFHEADKKAAILGEKLNADRSIEIFFGGGLGLGGAILGLAPFFWPTGVLYGITCIVIGAILIVVSCIGRAVKK